MKGTFPFLDGDQMKIIWTAWAASIVLLDRQISGATSAAPPASQLPLAFGLVTAVLMCVLLYSVLRLESAKMRPAVINCLAAPPLIFAYCVKANDEVGVACCILTIMIFCWGAWEASVIRARCIRILHLLLALIPLAIFGTAVNSMLQWMFGAESLFYGGIGFGLFLAPFGSLYIGRNGTVGAWRLQVSMLLVIYMLCGIYILPDGSFMRHWVNCFSSGIVKTMGEMILGMGFAIQALLMYRFITATTARDRWIPCAGTAGILVVYALFFGGLEQSGGPGIAMPLLAYAIEVILFMLLMKLSMVMVDWIFSWLGLAHVTSTSIEQMPSAVIIGSPIPEAPSPIP